MTVFKTLFVLILMMAFSSSIFAQEIDDNKLTVYGKIKIICKTDRTRIAFEIEGLGKSLANAFNDANTKMDSISRRLFAIGLTDKNLSTSFFRSSENNGGKGFLTNKKDYKSSMTVDLVTDSLELLEEIAIILTESDTKWISDISFELVDVEEIRINALRKAILKAKEKANLISQLLGFELDYVIGFKEIKHSKINTESIRYRSQEQLSINAIMNEPILESQNSQSSIYAQEISFDTEVKVVYKIAGGGEQTVLEQEQIGVLP